MRTSHVCCGVNCFFANEKYNLVDACGNQTGITSMGRRNIVGVRCSIRMEVPIAEDGELLIPEEYLRFLTALANKKMEANFQRTQKFLSNFKDQV